MQNFWRENCPQNCFNFCISYDYDLKQKCVIPIEYMYLLSIILMPTYWQANPMTQKLYEWSLINHPLDISTFASRQKDGTNDSSYVRYY